ATWTAPFQLSSTTFGAFSTTTDYEANDVTIGPANGAIIAAWAENNHFARIGTFQVGTPTPTNTPCSPVPCTATNTPTSTRTPTPTITPTITPTPCGQTGNYNISQSTEAAIVPGTSDIGNHGDDIVTTIALP